jgi:transcriptional regulator with XRE-family HTH domain/anti-sigma regulatory factor (Ser/Thr protein kinase)
MMSESGDAPVISLAERLKSRREQLGLSQAQAARELDVARTAYRLWEMEAAKPQPDRWRLISRWLGVSVTTMLLADDLDDEPETAAVSAAFARVGNSWNVGPRDPHEFFAAIRNLIREATEEGFINPEHAEELLATLARVEHDRIGIGTEIWEPARLHKQFATTPQAPRKAREAVDFVAGDLPEDHLQAAQLLTSELVTKSVKHSPSSNATISVDLELNRNRLRVEVRDGGPPSSPTLTDPSEDGGYGLVFLDQLSSRWETERERAGNLSWFELDLPAPGSRPERP